MRFADLPRMRTSATVIALVGALSMVTGDRTDANTPGLAGPEAGSADTAGSLDRCLGNGLLALFPLPFLQTGDLSVALAHAADVMSLG